MSFNIPIQIKICAEYQDMAPKAKVSVPGTCCTWKPVEALGTMLRHSAQILICFIAFSNF